MCNHTIALKILLNTCFASIIFGGGGVLLYGFSTLSLSLSSIVVCCLQIFSLLSSLSDYWLHYFFFNSLPSTLVCSLQTFCFFPQQCRPVGCDSVGNHYRSSGPRPKKRSRKRYTSLNSMKRNWRKFSWIPGFRRRKWWLCLSPEPSGRASRSCWISSWDILVQRFELSLSIWVIKVVI